MKEIPEPSAIDVLKFLESDLNGRSYEEQFMSHDMDVMHMLSDNLGQRPD